MKRAMCMSIVLAAGSTVALGAPREQIEFTNVNSNNRINATLTPAGAVAPVVNEVRAATVVGGYPVGQLTIDGEISRSLADGLASWFGEACILVTPPGGARPFVVQPIVVADPGATVATGTIPAGAFAIPVTTIADAAGEWSFQFFETFDDNESNTAAGGAVANGTFTTATDATWTRIRFTLDDAAPAPFTPPLPPGATSFFETTFTNQESNLASLTLAPSQTFVVPAGANILAFQAFGRATALGATSGANQVGSLTDDVGVRLVAPGADPADATIPFGLPVLGGDVSTANGDISIGYPTPLASGGTWTALFLETTNTLGTPDVADNMWNSITIRLIDSISPPPAEANFGVLQSGVVNSATMTFTSPQQVKWVRFEIPTAIRFPSEAALRIDTEGSVTSTPGSTTANAQRDTTVALFRNNGTRVATDFGDGSDSLGQLTYGFDNLPGAPASPGLAGSAAGARYNGRDGFLDAGVYWVGVTAGSTGVTVAPALFGVVVGPTNTTVSAGTGVKVNVTYLNPAPEADNVANQPATPGAQNFGVVGVLPPATLDENTASAPVVNGTSPTAPLNVNWFRFTTTTAAAPASDFFLDIDTTGSAIPEVPNPNNPLVPLIEANDTEIALYTARGNLIIKNDDNSATEFSSSLSFGTTNGSRLYPIAGGTAFSGQNGALPAGTYFIAAAPFQVVFGLNDPADTGVATQTRATDGTRSDTNFRVERRAVSTTPPANAVAGTITVNLRTNLPGGCGASDVASSGQIVGADGQLTADDIIVFIGWFFAADARADVASSGQIEGADGQFTADDIIVFIGRFFAGC